MAIHLRRVTLKHEEYGSSFLTDRVGGAFVITTPNMWELLLQGPDGSETQSRPNVRNLASLGMKNRPDARRTTS